MVAIYTGNLVASMAVQKTRIPINDLYELAAHPEYQAGVMKGSVVNNVFQVCTLYILKWKIFIVELSFTEAFSYLFSVVLDGICIYIVVILLSAFRL